MATSYIKPLRWRCGSIRRVLETPSINAPQAQGRLCHPPLPQRKDSFHWFGKAAVLPSQVSLKGCCTQKYPPSDKITARTIPPNMIRSAPRRSSLKLPPCTERSPQSPSPNKSRHYYVSKPLHPAPPQTGPLNPESHKISHASAKLPGSSQTESRAKLKPSLPSQNPRHRPEPEADSWHLCGSRPVRTLEASMIRTQEPRKLRAQP